MLSIRYIPAIVPAPILVPLIRNAMSADSNQPPATPRSEDEVLADPRLHEWLQRYHPLFHESCLKSYAQLLHELHHHGKNYEASLEYLLHQHDKAAAEALWLLQHQKLFDLECQWRAGLVAVPGAQLSSNFEDWHDDIQACPVLSPISDDEVAVLDAFLAESDEPDALDLGNPTHDFWLHRRYPHMRDADWDEQQDLTEFTQFWDQHRGTGYLRQLPDPRGEQEAHYEMAARAEQRRRNPPPPAAAADPRPHVPTYGAEFDDLAREWLRRFEPAVNLRQFEAKLQMAERLEGNDDTDLEVALERLKDAGPGLVPIQAHADWRQGIIEASNRYYLDQVRAALPHVYDAYCQREQLGIRQAPVAERRRRKRAATHFDWQQEIIREGRRALGEPDDLDF
ncbi:hypothetical protein CLV45_1773 [Hymenobacter chitinivorans DSM 11115]|uniref:Uncharacterized protein n=2 Tax=Hymenobacter chitinivorans TaxID=89969 RepID=A0A2M9BQX7_9BACT|nr:hypothetical protein CLV45_1773 [Hymenobacter chitinivorans DSM 11115]